MIQTNPSADRFVFASSVAAELWQPRKDAEACEWWHFDALSDDGREAVVIVFMDDLARSLHNDAGNGSESERLRSPALSFTYFADGKIVYRSEQRFAAEEFSASESELKCRIGNSGFRFGTATYGSGFLVSVDLSLPKGRRLRANFEWLSVESDLAAPPANISQAVRLWNMAVPRSDVSGRITVDDSRRRVSHSHSFRGTGYHDHNRETRRTAEAISERHWGRAHFADSTVVFRRSAEVVDKRPATELMIVRNGKLTRSAAEMGEIEFSRDKGGNSYPTRFRIDTDEGISLESESATVIDSSFNHLRLLNSMHLTADGHRHSACGITELLLPKPSKKRWRDWLSLDLISKAF